MNEVIYLVQRARMRAMELNGQLATRYGVAAEQLPIGALKMAGNHSVVAIELLTHLSPDVEQFVRGGFRQSRFAPTRECGASCRSHEGSAYSVHLCI